MLPARIPSILALPLEWPWRALGRPQESDSYPSAAEPHPPAHQRRPKADKGGPESSIPAFTCLRAYTRPYGRRRFGRDAKSTTSSWRGSRWHSGSGAWGETKRLDNLRVQTKRVAAGTGAIVAFPISLTSSVASRNTIVGQMRFICAKFRCTS
jgi:hypothetical protein